MSWDAFASLVQSLDEDQRAVARWRPEEGTMRIPSAAGSGKTRTLVALIAALIHGNRVTPQQLVITTFSSDAAKVLHERLSAVLPAPVVAALWLGTWHSLGLQYVRGAAAQRKQFWRWRSENNLDGRDNTLGPGGKPIHPLWLWRDVLGHRPVPGTRTRGLRVDLDDHGLTAHDYQLEAQVLGSRGLWPGVRTGIKSRLPQFGAAWKLFEESKKGLKAWDFADVISHWRMDLRRQQAGEQQVAKLAGSAEFPILPWTGQGRIVLVDEAQDNTRMMVELARRLAGPTGRIVLTGDPGQCIHTWRGAFPKLFLNADKELGAITRELPNNYRSGSSIVELGNRFTDGQAWCGRSPARAARGAQTGAVPSGKITAREMGQDPWEEAERVAEEISQRIQQGTAPTQFAILARTRARTGLFTLACLHHKIPVSPKGLQAVFQTKEAKAFRAWCALAQGDDPVAFAAAARTPQRFLGGKWIDRIASHLKNGRTLMDVLYHEQRVSKGRTKDNIMGLLTAVRDLRQVPWEKQVNMIGHMLRPAPKPRGVTGNPTNDRAEAVDALVSVAHAHADYTTFCAAVDTPEDAAVGLAFVTVSTAHSAKGLEWPIVYVSMAHGVWPHPMSAKEGREDEEQRLAYVAVTRAQDELNITWSAFGFPNKRGKPQKAGPGKWVKEFVLPKSAQVELTGLPGGAGAGPLEL